MRRRGLLWPLAMAALLLAVVITNIAVAIVAADDPSFAIEPDYYRRAVAWDSAMNQARRNVALAWRVNPALGAYHADSGATLRVSVTDSAGIPIRDASISVTALHVARAADAYTTMMAADGAHGYVVTLPVHRAGQWELRLDVTRGADRFTSSVRVEATPSSSP